ncbi:MAG: tRNA preQ1(34) S-adenosylmethionine ribosyltransferase-isomerase QueA [Bacteroidales bacterium]|jgi:S-adenosylmethionine:tRNA ribosyltransferase-isomerase|nr:tRNA preQ1(34) S-adenosylmethionine ribosyltransferase-isomerase QueA [Bacteroidales bacterium]
MRLSQYKFHLPPELISKYPTPLRDEARLMVINRQSNRIEHRKFKDIIDYFKEGDIMVLNNTKVFPARLYGNKEKTGAQIEVFLLRELNPEQRLWDVLVDPARKIRIGNKLYFGDNDALVAEVIDNTTSRGRTLRFLFDGDHEKFKSILFGMGKTPIPKALKRELTADDKDRYQTIFAKHEGAVAAPCAGLHFSRELLKRFEIKGIDTTEVTLHMGLGNFRSVDVEDLTKHKMDSEQMIITEEAANTINAAKDRKAEVCAVGTTVLRTLESSVSTNGKLKPADMWTNKFLFPPYEVTVPTAFVTNFHLPVSTMMMMTSSFTGYDLLMDVYNTAVKEKYNFGTFGDAMLVL